MPDSRWRSALTFTFSRMLPLFLLTTAGIASAAPLPVGLFSDRPQIGAISLSPDGKRLAVLGNMTGKGYGLYLIEIDTLKPRQLLQPGFNWVTNIRWLDDTWITFGTADEYGFWTGNSRIDTSSKDPNPIGGAIESRCRHMDDASAPPPRDGSTWLICWKVRGAQVVKQDLSTGKVEWLTDQEGFGDYWLDHKGVIRAKVTCEERPDAQFCTTLYRDDETTDFLPVASWETGEAGALWPAGFDFDDRTLFVYASPQGGPAGLYRWDTANKSLGDVVFQHAEFDVESMVLSRHERKVVGVRFDDGLSKVHWIDTARAELDREINALFPGQTTSVSFSDDGKRALVHVFSDRNPGEWHLYYPESKTLRFLSKRHPKIDPALMAPERPISYRARDGLAIYGYLTVPMGSEGKALPLIVNPHGGPFGIRDEWGFDPETQFLASRGYAVLKINFRGSGGYGFEFQKAGWGEWGLKMQDDITDGVLWAIEQGVADRDRICIYGASYGGYAALMGLIKTPELYRCGIDYVGVSDLVKLFHHGMRGTGFTHFTRARRAWFRRVIGGRWGDAQALAAVSPMHQIERIQAPLLVVHGKRDPIVPYAYHAYDFTSELEDEGKEFEVLFNDKEGHGFRKPENVRELYLTFEAFLAKHLAPRVAQPTAKEPSTR